MVEVDPVARGLHRLYRYRRLLQLIAPLPVLAQSKKLLMDSKKALGARWPEVVRLYPEYAVEQNKANTIDLRWEARCHGCIFWKGPPWEWQDEDLDIQKVQWCERFKLDQTSRPEECPDFSEKGDLN